MMPVVMTGIGYYVFNRIIQLYVWLVLCFGITSVAAFIQWISKKNLIRWVIKIEVAVTAYIIIWMLVDDLIDIIKYRSMWFGIWLALCFAVTAVTVVVQLINKKFRKKKPIHWVIKLAGYVAFYTISYFIMKTMQDVLIEIGYLIFCRIIQPHVWPVLCLGITAVAAFIQWISKKNLIRRVIKIEVTVTACIIIWMLVDDTIKYELWYGVWLALCFAVTAVTVVVQLINKKIRKKKPIHWMIKLAGYAVFYAVSYFASMNLFGSYPGNWLATDKEYRELAYGLYHLTLEHYEYRKISEGANGEIVLYFRNDDKDILDQNLERTTQQRDHVTIKNAVEEYIRMNGGFQGKRIEIEFSEIDPYLCHAWTFTGHIYNFDPWTGEIGTDASYWFVKDVDVNNCTELAEFYYDFSGISANVDTLDDMQELTNIRNLIYLELNVFDMNKEDKDQEDQYIEELNTLLPGCEIHLK